MYDKLPMFTRIGIAALKPNLTNTIKLCNILQNPELNFKSIHIAGTNGKGSTSHILASVLHEAGFKVGLYTSPHLKDFRERIRINGKMISKKFIVDFVKKHKSEFEEIKPSFFEMTVGLCFDYFSKNKIDIAVIETGLGGRLDSTNIITPLLSVITNIGYDHMELLGETLDKIAYEKAGIIKKNIPVVVGEYLPETKSVFIKTAKKNKSKLEFAEDIFACVNFKQTKNRSKCSILKSGEIIYKKLESDLAGIYQQKNFVTSISAIEQLQLQGFKITEKNILNGFAKVKRNTGLMGRVRALYATAYVAEQFVEVLPAGALPALAQVNHSNMCMLGLAVVGETLIVVSALDNLIKGASGQAVQNMNVMFGLAESAGLV